MVLGLYTELLLSDKKGRSISFVEWVNVTKVWSLDQTSNFTASDLDPDYLYIVLLLPLSSNGFKAC